MSHAETLKEVANNISDISTFIAQCTQQGIR